MTTEILINKLNSISTYPKSMKEICCEIKGVGFFPGARGLWEANDNSINNKSTMILGHDFGTENDYLLSVKREHENLNGLTWKNLLLMLEEYDIDKKDVFFTNAIMGARTNTSAIGISPAFSEKEFLKDCTLFFIEQVKIQKPRIIIALGTHIWHFLSIVSSELLFLEKIKSYSELDQKELSIISNVKFSEIPNFETNIAFITHPTYWHLNVKNRNYKNFIGKEAEKEIIKDTIQMKNYSQESLPKNKTNKDMNSGNFVIYKVNPN